MVDRLQREKPEFAKRHRDLLAERYDLADRAATGVTMSRGKPVQDGVGVRRWIGWYNDRRPHQALGYLGPRQYRALQLQRVA
jgi:transposase InsO family protein